MLGNGGNHADGGTPIERLPIACRTATEGFVYGDELVARDEFIEYGLRADIAHRSPRAAHRHGLDEAQGELIFDAVAEHLVHILLIDVLQQHHIEFDLREARAFGNAQTVQNFGQAVIARNLLYAFTA